MMEFLNGILGTTKMNESTKQPNKTCHEVRENATKTHIFDWFWWVNFFHYQETPGFFIKLFFTQDVWNSPWHVNGASILGFQKRYLQMWQKLCQYPIPSMGLVYSPTWKPIKIHQSCRLTYHTWMVWAMFFGWIYHVGFRVGKYTIVPWMRHGYCQACEHCNGCDKSHSKGPMGHIFRGAFHRPECWYQIGWFKRHFWVLKVAKRRWKVLVCSLRCLYSIKVRMFLYQHVLLLI